MRFIDVTLPSNGEPALTRLVLVQVLLRQIGVDLLDLILQLLDGQRLSVRSVLKLFGDIALNVLMADLQLELSRRDVRDGQHVLSHPLLIALEVRYDRRLHGLRLVVLDVEVLLNGFVVTDLNCMK